MDNDLISRKAVIELIKSKQSLEDAFTLLDDVEEMPSAYDVGKVVEQISNMHFDFAEVSSNKYNVLKIVKAGGVD